MCQDMKHLINQMVKIEPKLCNFPGIKLDNCDPSYLLYHVTKYTTQWISDDIF
jgi:hypothetical protein